MSTFETLNGINVNEHTEKKGKLTYLSWAWAWAEVKKQYPDAAYTVKKDVNGFPYFGDEKTGYMVFTEVTIDKLTYEMWLPVMDYQNKAMLKPTMFDINKSIMRCLTKNLAMFGLGLYIYAGEDLPETDDAPPQDGDTKPATISDNQVKQLTLMFKVFKNPTKVREEYCVKYGIGDLSELTVGEQFVNFRNEVMTAATAEKDKRINAMLNTYQQKTNTSATDALAAVENLIGKKISDVSIAEFPAVMKKVADTLKDE